MEAVREQEEPDSGSEDHTDSESEDQELEPADELQTSVTEGESSANQLSSSIDLQRQPSFIYDYRS